MLNEKSKNNKELSCSDLHLFCTELSMIIKAGIPIADGIEAMSEGVAYSDAKDMMLTLNEKLSRGQALYEALKEAEVFPKHMIFMVEIGEKSGKLDDVIVSLADYYDKEDKLKKQIKSAITYPFFMMIMVMSILFVLINKVFPIFNVVFETLGVGLSSGVDFTISAATMILQVLIVLIIAIIVLIGITFFVFRNKQSSLNDFLSKFALTKNIFKKISIARFANIMAMLVGSGYNMDEALVQTQKVVDNSYIISKIEICIKLLRDGKSTGDAIEGADIFSSIYNGMIKISLRTGNFDKVMNNISNAYSQMATDTIQKIINAIEPTMASITSIIVGTVLLSIMLPLMGVLSSMG